jgi:CheY-like chemotaxis protein
MNPSCVLQVEDDSNDIYLLEYTFKRASFPAALQAVRNAEQATEYLSGTGRYADREKFPFPCLILLDLKLTGSCGLWLLAWIRKHEHIRTLPVIILTSSANRNDIQQAYALGANAYLVKPTGPDQLLKLVQSLACFWLSHNQLPDTPTLGFMGSNLNK